MYLNGLGIQLDVMDTVSPGALEDSQRNAYMLTFGFLIKVERMHDLQSPC